MRSDQLFFIAIIPPNQLREEIQEIKKTFLNKYKTRHALKSPPHITLIPPFKLRPDDVKILSKMLDDFVERQSSIEVDLNGYGCFKPRVIFLNPVMSEKLNALHDALADMFYTCFPNLKSSERRFHPHLSIAFRDLKPNQFNLAWKECRNLEFNASFKVDGLYLLKHDGQQWQEYQKFDFRAL
jgi:2'-5' RNA ligase